MKTKQTFSLRQLNGGTCNKSKEINEMYSYGLLEYNFFYIFIFYGMSFYFDNKHRDSVAYWCKIGLHFQAFQGSSEVNDYEMQFSKIRQGGSTQIQKMFEKLHTTHLKLFLAPFISSGNNVRTVWVIFVGLSFFVACTTPRVCCRSCVKRIQCIQFEWHSGIANPFESENYVLINAKGYQFNTHLRN